MEWLIGLLLGAVLAVAVGVFARLYYKTQGQQTRDALARSENQLAGAQKTVSEQAAEIAKLQATAEHSERAAAEKITGLQAQMDKFDKQIKEFLQNTARDILSENRRHLKAENKESLDNAINPLKENINTFRTSLEKVQREQAEKTAQLTTQITTLFETTQTVADSANNLSRALKGDKKAQGLWGEMQLANLLNASGLTEGQDYDLQATVQTPQGRQVPDCLLHLPQGKCLIVDAKVSLVAYERYINSEPPDKTQLQQHIADLRAHIRNLADKKYDAAVSGTVDFVLMFMPLEAAFIEALKHSPEIYQEAFNQRIILTSPTTLLPILKTVAYLWNMDKQQKNLNNIAEEGKKLYDKLCNFSDSMNELGKSIRKTAEAYNAAGKRMSEGRGNLQQQAQKLAAMGVGSQKTFQDIKTIETDPSPPTE